MSQPLFDTKINCLEQLKDEIGINLKVDPTNFTMCFHSFRMFTLILMNLEN